MANRSTDVGQHSMATEKKWLQIYVLLLATMAFVGRAIPLSFLPICLETDFEQSSSSIGVVMALYPLSALITTPWASAIARSTRRIITLHSLAIVMIACAMALSAAAPYFQAAFGSAAGTVWIGVCRALQGVGASFYLSSNTCLLARNFPDDLTYLIAMTEVAVGAGGQIGRMAGGFLYDFGGLSCPFLCCALFQMIFGFVGLAFETEISTPLEEQASEGIQKTAQHNAAQESKLMPWSSLLKARVCLGALAAFMMYFLDGVIGATILQWMSVHLAPVSVGIMSVCTSFRSVCYLITSFILAQFMHGQLISYECLIICGSMLALVRINLLAPQQFIIDAQTMLTGSGPSYESMWVVQLLSFAICSSGNACLFVPSLPLMQSEVHEFGPIAVEQVAEVFVMMMTLGEMVGPLFGGMLVENFGFVVSTQIVAFLFIPMFLLGFATYDRAAISDRRRSSASTEDVEGFTSPVSCGPRCAVVPSDGEANFALRRLPFAIAAKRHDLLELGPGSAPPDVFRRKYGSKSSPLLEVEARMRYVPSTAPSQSFRRQYAPPSSKPAR
jgi:predicted MFS family arabinose efflux permease